MNDLVPAQQLSMQQKRFVTATCNGLSELDAGKYAGYADPHSDGHSVSRLPHVIAAVQAELRRRLVMRAAPAALKFLEESCSSSGKVDRGRLDAAKSVLDRAGLSAPRAAGEKAPGEFGDMSVSQLKEFVARVNGVLADRAKVIDNVPDPAPNGAQDVDIFG